MSIGDTNQPSGVNLNLQIAVISLLRELLLYSLLSGPRGSNQKLELWYLFLFGGMLKERVSPREKCVAGNLSPGVNEGLN